MAIPPKYDRPWNPSQTSGNKDYSIPVPMPIGKPWQDYNAGNSSGNNPGETIAPPYGGSPQWKPPSSPQYGHSKDKDASVAVPMPIGDPWKGGVNLDQIKKNFNDYQVNSGGGGSLYKQLQNEAGGGINFDKYKNPTDDKVYMGGSKYFNESTGQYENLDAVRIGEGRTWQDDQPTDQGIAKGTRQYEKPHTMPSIGKYTGIDQNGNMVHPEKHAAEAQQYKDRYKNNLKKFMNYSGDTTTNTTTSEENNFDQNAGNKGDWTGTIGDQNEIWHSNINNDYSVNIAGIGDGFSNMQGAAAYTALNNNQHARSSSEINGLRRASQASQEADRTVGAKDRAANLYNSLGYSQNYWRQKADAQQNFYLGDIFAQKAPPFQFQPNKSDPMDDSTVQDTVDDFKDELD